MYNVATEDRVTARTEQQIELQLTAPAEWRKYIHAFKIVYMSYIWCGDYYYTIDSTIAVRILYPYFICSINAVFFNIKWCKLLQQQIITFFKNTLK